MKQNNRFFTNKECEYFPCHKTSNTDEFNCLFCYCPLYNHSDCGGNVKFIDIEDSKIKDCSDCMFPHVPKNYDKIINKLREVHQ